MIQEDAGAKEKVLALLTHNKFGTWFSHGSGEWFITRNLSEKGRKNYESIMHTMESDLKRGLRNIKVNMKLTPDGDGYIDFLLNGTKIAQIKTVPPIDYNKGAVPYPFKPVDIVGSIDFRLFLSSINFDRLSSEDVSDISTLIEAMIYMERVQFSNNGW